MKLDFSGLKANVKKNAGTLGTAGTSVTARVCVSPPSGDSRGQSADENNLSPLSPLCSQRLGTLNPGNGGMSPMSPLSPAEKQACIPDREDFEERAAIMEYDGELPRAEAERLVRLDLMGLLN